MPAASSSSPIASAANPFQVTIARSWCAFLRSPICCMQPS
jgi:hypothetical protein